MSSAKPAGTIRVYAWTPDQWERLWVYREAFKHNIFTDQLTPNDDEWLRRKELRAMQDGLAHLSGGNRSAGE